MHRRRQALSAVVFDISPISEDPQPAASTPPPVVVAAPTVPGLRLSRVSTSPRTSQFIISTTVPCPLTLDIQDAITRHGYARPPTVLPNLWDTYRCALAFRDLSYIIICISPMLINIRNTGTNNCASSTASTFRGRFQHFTNFRRPAAPTSTPLPAAVAAPTAPALRLFPASRRS